MIIYEVNAYVKEKEEVKAVSLPTLLYIIGLYAERGGEEDLLYFDRIIPRLSYFENYFIRSKHISCCLTSLRHSGNAEWGFVSPSSRTKCNKTLFIPAEMLFSSSLSLGPDVNKVSPIP
jgi:hypothetical protein